MLLCLFLSVGCAASAAAMEVRPAADDRSVLAPMADRSLLLDGAAADGLWVAVGERGHVLRSEDGGESWRQVEVPTRATLTAVYLHSRELGWAVGHDQVILRTADGGATWERVNYAPESESPLLDVWFRDERQGYAVGAYGTFLETMDGGTTWTERSVSDDDLHLNRLAATADGRLYLAAEAGTLYRSLDGGQNWESLPTPYEGSFFGVLPLEDDAVLLFGLRGNLFRSEDAGYTWQTLKTGVEASLTDSTVTDDGRVVVVGLGGTVLVSRDRGHTFAAEPRPDRKGISAVLPLKGDRILLFGEAGVEALRLP